MSGASEVFSPADMAEKQRVQALNLATQRRLLESQPRSAIRADETALTAEREARERASVVPPRRMAPPASIFAPVLTGAKIRAEQDKTIKAAREAVKVRAMNGPEAAPTSAEKGERPKREKVPAPEKCPPVVAALTFDEKVKAFCDAEAAKLAKSQAKRLAYTYDLPGAPGVLSGHCERSQFPSVAVDLCRNGSRMVTPSEGWIVTLIHVRASRDAVTGLVTEKEFSVGRRYVKSEVKGHEVGAKALASGLPKTVTCPDCKGIGRVVDNFRGKDCPKCDAKGTIAGLPTEVHAYHVSRDVVRAGPRGVMALDRPLAGDPIVPSRKRGAICTGGKPASGVWQSRAKTTRVTFSGG